MTLQSVIHSHCVGKPSRVGRFGDEVFLRNDNVCAIAGLLLHERGIFGCKVMLVLSIENTENKTYLFQQRAGLSETQPLRARCYCLVAPLHYLMAISLAREKKGEHTSCGIALGASMTAFATFIRGSLRRLLIGRLLGQGIS